MKVEVVLGKCGGLSRYQVILLFLFCMINVLSAWHYYSQTIISFVPDHWCFEDDQESPDEFLLSMRGEKSSCEAQLGANTSCDHYIYDLYMGYESLISELNWVCQSSWMVTVGHAIFFVGSVVGTFTFGILADVIGRIPILIAANLVAMTGNLLTVFTNSWYSFCLFRFISGLATDSNFVMMYILVVEYIDISFRTVGISLCIGIFYCIGSATAPWIAVATKSWKTFLLVTSIPFGFVPMVYFMVPESIQWLVAKQKFELAANSLKKIAKLNHRSIEATDINTFIQECRTKAEKEQKLKQSLCGLFKTPRLRRNTLILFFKSMVITLCYDAVSRNVQGKGVSPFVLFSLSAVTIFPACILLIILQDKIGRKAMSALSLLFSGLFISTSGFILSSQRFSENNVTLLIILSLAGRFGVTVAYNSAAQYATELIPTCVRCQGVAMVHVIGYGFTFFSSYILHSQVIFNAMPELILGTMSFIGSFLCLFLPETTNRSLPNTLEEGEDFGKDEHFLTFYCFKGDR